MTFKQVFHFWQTNFACYEEWTGRAEWDLFMQQKTEFAQSCVLTTLRLCRKIYLPLR